MSNMKKSSNDETEELKKSYQKEKEKLMKSYAKDIEDLKVNVKKSNQHEIESLLLKQQVDPL